MTYLNMLVMFLHISAAIIWVGGLVYLRLILLPGLGRVPPAARGPVVLDVGPRTITLLLRVAEITIATGIANLFLLGRVTRIEHFFTTLWGQAIFLGFLGAMAIYLLGLTVTRPTTLRIVATIKAVAAGQPPADAPALLESLAARQRNVVSLQLGIATAVVLSMAVARFS